MDALFGKHPDSYLDIESLNSEWKASESLAGERILMGILQKSLTGFQIIMETAKEC